MAVPRAKKPRNKMITRAQLRCEKEMAIKITQLVMIASAMDELKLTPEQGFDVIMRSERYVKYIDDPVAGIKLRDIAESLYKTSEGYIDLLDWWK